MIIIKRGYYQGVYEINSYDSLLSYINNSMKIVNVWVGINNNIKSIADNIINNNDTISHKQFYILYYNKMKGNSCSRYTIDFWVNRGYNEVTAINNIQNIQSKNADMYTKKRKENPELYVGVTSTQIEYWIKKGYNEADAKLKVKDRQTTFSLDICVKKYGKVEGTKKFKERQVKWQNSRQDSLNNNIWDTSSCGNGERGHLYYFNTYGETWILEKLKSLEGTNIKHSHINDLLELHDVLYVKRIQLLDYIKSLSFKRIRRMSKNKVMLFLLNETPINIMSIWCEANDIKFIKNNRGNQYWYKGHFFKSDNEFVFGKYLLDSSVNFKSNKKYPNSNRFYDYYLIDHDLYIEFTGMRDKDYTNKMIELSNYDINIIWSNSIKQLKKLINEKYI